MPLFKPFKGVRSKQEFVESFISESIDSSDKETIQGIIESQPDSFLQIVKSTWENIDLPKEERFSMVRESYQDFLSREILTQDQASFYIYRQELGEVKIEGIIGAIHLKDFEANQIKQHEETLQNRKELFAAYLKQIDLYAEPVLLTHPTNQRIELIREVETRKSPTFKFTDKKGIQHSLWRVKDRMNLKQLKDSVEKMDALYIADGHHRMGSSFMHSQMRKQENKSHAGIEDYNFTLAYLVSNDNLIIKDFNRMIKDLNGHSSFDLLNLLQEKFVINRKGNQPYYPTRKHHISMYLEGCYYSLYVKPEFRGKPKGLGELDTFLFEQSILEPMFNIYDSRNDDRIDFIPGTGNVDGVIKMQEKIDSGEFHVGFSFFPISVKDLCLIADLNLKMPPKSTFIEPKLLSGLVMLDVK